MTYEYDPNTDPDDYSYGEYRGSGEPCDEEFDRNLEGYGSRYVPDERDVWGDER